MSHVISRTSDSESGDRANEINTVEEIRKRFSEAESSEALFAQLILSHKHRTKPLEEAQKVLVCENRKDLQESIVQLVQRAEVQRRQELEALTIENMALKTKLLQLQELQSQPEPTSQLFDDCNRWLCSNKGRLEMATLNSEIILVATFLGNTLVYDLTEEDGDRFEYRRTAIGDSYNTAEWMLGGYLVDLLACGGVGPRPGHSRPNSLLVQIIMHTALSAWCGTVADMWKPGDIAASSVFADIYQDICATEEQSVAGRWRSLTCSHIHYSTSDWKHNIMVGLLAVMRVAGWSIPTSGDLLRLEDHFLALFKAVEDLRKTMGQAFTSVDLSVAFVNSGDQFDPITMEEAYPRPLKKEGASFLSANKVASTVGLGLKGAVSRMSKGQVVGSTELFVEPKVVLRKTVEELIK